MVSQISYSPTVLSEVPSPVYDRKSCQTKFNQITQYASGSLQFLDEVAALGWRVIVNFPTWKEQRLRIRSPDSEERHQPSNTDTQSFTILSFNAH